MNPSHRIQPQCWERLQSRAFPAFRTVPILILTTESSDEAKQRGRAAGATGWITKPFDPAQLREVVGKVLRVQAAQ